MIPADKSPHHFAFKPSHFNLLDKTDLLIWVDNHFESGMESMSKSAGEKLAVLQLSSVLDHDLLDKDHHFWYSASELINAIQSISAKLAELDSDNTEIYHQNAIALIGKINDWRSATALLLRSQQTGIITQHEFLYTFSQDFDIEPFPSLLNQHDEGGTIKRVRNIENYIESNPVQCMLTLETPVSALAGSIVKNFSLQLVNLNNATNNSTSGDIIERLNRLSNAIVNCQPSH